MTDDEDVSTDEHFPEPNTFIHDPYNYMAVRENMQEFPGRVPHRKRKKGNQQQDSSKPKVRKEKDFRSDLKHEIHRRHPLSENKP